MPDTHVTMGNSKGVCGPFPRSVWTHPYSPADDFDRLCAEIWKRTVRTKKALWSFGSLGNDDQAVGTADGLERVVKPRDLDEVALMIRREHQILLHEHCAVTATSAALAPGDICSHGDEMPPPTEEKEAHVSAVKQERDEEMMSQEKQCRSIEKFLKGLLIHKKEAKEVPTLSEEDFPPLPCPSGDMKQVGGLASAGGRAGAGPAGTRRTAAPHWGPLNPAARSKLPARAAGLSSGVKDIPKEGCRKSTAGQQRSQYTCPVQPIQPIQAANPKPLQAGEPSQAALVNQPPWPKPPSTPHMGHCPLQPSQCHLRRPPSQSADPQHQHQHPHSQHQLPHPQRPYPHHHPSFPSTQAGPGPPPFSSLPQAQVQAQAHPQQIHTTRLWPGPSQPTAQQWPGPSQPTAQQWPGSSQPTAQQWPGPSQPTAQQRPGPSQPTAQQRPCSYQPMTQQRPCSYQPVAQNQPQQHQFPQQQQQYKQQIPLQDHQRLPQQQQQQQLPPTPPQSCPPGGIQQHPMMGLHNPYVTMAMPSMHGLRAPPGFSHPQVVNVPTPAHLAALGMPYGLLAPGCHAVPSMPPPTGAPRPNQHPSMAGDAPPWPSLALTSLSRLQS